MQLTKTFDLPPDCDCASIEVRRTNGHDEQAAAMAATAKGNAGMIQEELIKLAIVSVDGKRVVNPYEEFTGWSTRTRFLVNLAYQDLNDVKPEDVASFLASANAGKKAEKDQGGPQPSTT